MDLAALRRDYRQAALDEASVAADPLEQFARWFEEARASGVQEPNAMTLATVGPTGQPSARVVLLKGIDEQGLVFFTDRRSRKGRELAANPAGAAVFWWPELERQVRVSGSCAIHPDSGSDAYFAVRPRGSQLGAWASEQSSELASRAELERRLETVTERFGDGTVPRPPHWGGYRLVPHEFEFWQGRPDRLHDRILFTRTPEPGWRRARLSP